MGISRRSMVVGMPAIAASVAVSTIASGQTFPSKLIRMLLPSSPGSAIDTITRLMAPQLRDILGQAIVIENVAGASGLIGLGQLARSPRDGHTLSVVSANFSYLPALLKAAAYDPETDYQPISILTRSPIVLVVNSQLPVNNVQELVAMAKNAAPDKPPAYGSAGVGTPIHLAFELLASLTGTKWLHVPYKGFNQFQADLIGGQVKVGFSAIAPVKSFIADGTLRAIGIDSAKESRFMPGVVPIREQGVAFEYGTWLAMIGPAGMPPDVVAKINEAVAKVLRSDELAKAAELLSIEFSPASPEETARTIRDDRARFTKLIRNIGLERQ